MVFSFWKKVGVVYQGSSIIPNGFGLNLDHCNGKHRIEKPKEFKSFTNKFFSLKAGLN